MGLMDDVDYRRDTYQRHQENSARLAQSFASFTTSGQGSMEFEDRVDFGLTFTEEPFVAYGVYCDTDDLAQLQDLDPGTTPKFPLSSGFVTEWDKDERDFYIGCWIACTVSFSPNDAIALDLMPNLTHYFTFTAIGMKDVPTTDVTT